MEPESEIMPIDETLAEPIESSNDDVQTVDIESEISNAGVVEAVEAAESKNSYPQLTAAISRELFSRLFPQKRHMYGSQYSTSYPNLSYHSGIFDVSAQPMTGEKGIELSIQFGDIHQKIALENANHDISGASESSLENAAASVAEKLLAREPVFLQAQEQSLVDVLKDKPAVPLKVNKRKAEVYYMGYRRTPGLNEARFGLSPKINAQLRALEESTLVALRDLCGFSASDIPAGLKLSFDPDAQVGDIVVGRMLAKPDYSGDEVDLGPVAIDIKNQTASLLNGVF